MRNWRRRTRWTLLAAWTTEKKTTEKQRISVMPDARHVGSLVSLTAAEACWPRRMATGLCHYSDDSAKGRIRPVA